MYIIQMLNDNRVGILTISLVCAKLYAYGYPAGVTE